MNEAIDIPLSKELCLNANESMDKTLWLYDLMVKQKDRLKELLVGYYYMKRGLIKNLHWDKSSIIFQELNKGFFILFYDVEYTLGCQDLSHTVKEKMHLHFMIDIQGRVVRIIGEDILERPMDEI